MTSTARRPLALVVSTLVVATVVAVDPSGLVPSGPLRWTLTLALMGAAVCALCARPVRVDRSTGRLWCAFVAWLFVAALAGADDRYAWIGTPDRRLGWLAWCTFPLMFLCGQALVQTADRRVVMRGASVAGALLGIWCACERAGWSLIEESFAGHRVGGPFAQPAYVGAAAVLLLPLSLAIAFDRESAPSWRIVGALGVSGATVALLLSQTRGAWIGVLVAVVLLGSRHREVIRRHWREVVLGGFALVALFALTPLGGRVADGFHLGQGTTQGRFDDWSTGVRVIEQHPVLGVGPEGYRVVFPQVVSATYVRRHGTAVVPDRAHNGVIDVATEGGIVAGLLYAALLVSLVVVAWRALRSRDLFALALACAVVGYVVQQQFLFPLSELDPLFWLVGGMLLATRAASPTSPDSWTRRIPLALPVVLAVVVSFGAVMGAREVFADRLLERAARAPAASDLRDADHATRLRSDSIRAWYAAARIAARGPAITDVDAAIARVEHGLRESPRDPALRDLDADLVVERAARSGLDDDRNRARAVVTRYLTDAPNDPELWLDRAAVAHLDGDTATERDASDRAARLQPEEKS